MVFDMRKDKMLFVFKRYKQDDNKVLASKILSFLSITSFFIITQSFKSTIKNKSDENNFDVNSLKDIKKRLTSTLKVFKKKMIQKSDLLNIIKINASIYYYLIRNKENKFVSLIINEIYDTFIEFFEVLSSIKRDNRISINDLCSYNFEIKYKKCYKFYISKNSQINNIKILISQKMLSKFSIDYYNYINVFDRL